jgi:hypothetical protein
LLPLLFFSRTIGFPDNTASKTIESLTVHPAYDFPYYDFLLVKLVSYAHLKTCSFRCLAFSHANFFSFLAQDSAVLDTTTRAINTNASLPSIGDTVRYMRPNKEEINDPESVDIEGALLQIYANTECQNFVSSSDLPRMD